MTAVCAIATCDGTQFKCNLCEDHYLAVAHDASKTVNGAARSGQSRPLQSALFVFNRMVDTVISNYRRAFELRREDLVQLHIHEARGHMQRGDAQKAAEAIRKVEALEPQQGEIKRDLADVLLSQGRYDEALACYREGEQDGSAAPELGIKIAEALLGLGQAEEALQYNQRAVLTQPEDAEYQYALGKTLEVLGRYDEAVDAFSNAAALDAADPRYQQACGFAYEALGRHDRALGCFKAALELER